MNQVHDLTDPNPYQPGEAIGPDDCETQTTPSGTPITGDALLHLNIACGGDPSPSRPFVGFSNINFLQFAASSTYNALQFSARRSIAPLTLSVAYTYSHNIGALTRACNNVAKRVQRTHLSLTAAHGFNSTCVISRHENFDLIAALGAHEVC